MNAPRFGSACPDFPSFGAREGSGDCVVKVTPICRCVARYAHAQSTIYAIFRGWPYLFMIRLRKLQRRSLVPSCRDHSLQDLAFMVDGAPEIAELAVDLHKEVSGAGEFRPRALSEPDVILSHHPAPIVRPLLYGFALSMRVLPSPVALRPELNNATPSLQPYEPVAKLFGTPRITPLESRQCI